MGALKNFENFFEKTIFWSRWVQAPMYMGLAIGAFFYLYQFMVELMHMYTGLFIGLPDEEGVINKYTEGEAMLSMLALVDVSMVMNLVVMVIVGGYSIFTSKIDVQHHEDKPLWLDGLDAGMLKIKLATSLASISGVHLLKTFVDIRGSIQSDSATGILIEIAIHMAFIASAWLLSQTEKTIHSYGHYAHLDASHAVRVKQTDDDEDLEGL
ncbi:MAG: YqhA family protein [Cyclobacteriaceae bacterium]